jgi:hypothetical protein
MKSVSQSTKHCEVLFSSVTIVIIIINFGPLSVNHLAPLKYLPAGLRTIIYTSDEIHTGHSSYSSEVAPLKPTSLVLACHMGGFPTYVLHCSQAKLCSV